MVNNYGNWDFNFVFDNLPTNIVIRIIAFSIPNDANAVDTLERGGTSTIILLCTMPTI